MKTMAAVPRLDVWVACPRCSGPAHVVARGVFCTTCTWHADGAAPGHWCPCCGTWEAHQPLPVHPVEIRTCWRCPSCGRREVVTSIQAPRAPSSRTCACGASQAITWRDVITRIADGVDALYGLPFYLSTPCAGHDLWVANREHAQYLEWYISAGPRPRGYSGAPRHLGHRLPAWMTSHKNRQAVLKGLRRLLVRAEELEGR